MASDDELVFLPLGGSGEIGMNLNAYGFGPPDARQWIIVDIGVTFGREGDMPGVDLILPDPSFLEGEDVLAIVLTHAHEDHIGALPWLWPRFKTPVYATPFTAILVREKLKERGLLGDVKLHEVPLKGRIKIGPFDIEMVTLTHSIPEPNGLAIRTPLGLIWHTGDWKIDPNPQIGESTDEAKLKEIADEGVLAMVCDSTNVFVEGESGSEESVRETLADVIAACAGRVAVTAFASNVARVQSIMQAAHKAGRAVCLVGRSMIRVSGAARELNLISCDAQMVHEDEAAQLPAKKVLYLCTGSQGEERAALSRIADGDHRFVKLTRGDTVLFSSRVIPGNESAIYDLYNRLIDRGVDLITDRDAHIHVSGHPCRDELTQMYRWARPRIAVPVHGERRHLMEHAKLARELQIPEAIAPRNGDLIRLAPGPAAVIDETPSGRLFVDGVTVVSADEPVLKERKRLGAEGAINIAFALSEGRRKILSGPDVRLRGLTLESETELDVAIEALEDAAEAAFLRLKNAEREDERLAEAAVQRAVRKVADKFWGKRPFVEVMLLET